jgi:reactive intermediate/imine deaminase
MNARLALFAPLLLSCSGIQVRHINPPGTPKPPGYTHAVSASNARTIYVSGQVSRDASGKLVGARDFSAQTRQVFENVKAVLAASGATFADVVKLTVFVTDATKLADYRKVRDDYVGSEPPASSFVEVRALASPDFMIEMEAIAAAPLDR